MGVSRFKVRISVCMNYDVAIGQRQASKHLIARADLSEYK